MGGGSTQTTTSGLNNSALNSAVTTIGNQLNTQLNNGSKVFGQTLTPGAGTTTQNAWASGLSAASNPGYSAAVNNAIGEFGDIAAGNRMGEGDAGWNAARDRALTDVNSMFTTSGRFGSGSHVGSAAEGLAAVDLARLQGNESRQMQAAQLLPGLFSASTMPSQYAMGIGAAQDANAQAVRQGEADLFDRTNNAGWNTLQRGASVLAGTAPSAGTTTSTTTSQPWWQTGLGIGAGLLSFL